MNEYQIALLELMAKQKLPAEMSEYEYNYADFEDAYEIMVCNARDLLRSVS